MFLVNEVYNVLISHRLYESPKKQVDRTESALGWCRRILDNPNPETVAACRSLINKLDQSKQTAQTRLFSSKYF